MFNNPQLAYRAGYALLDPFTDATDLLYFRHVHEGGRGTVFTVPRGEVDVEDLVQSAGHQVVIRGALLVDVEAAAVETRSLQ